MAPGDLSQPVMAANNGTLAAGTKMYWNDLGVAAGQPILAEVTSTAFAPVLILLPPSAYNQSNGTFDFTQEIVDSNGAGERRPYLDYTATHGGDVVRDGREPNSLGAPVRSRCGCSPAPRSTIPSCPQP